MSRRAVAGDPGCPCNSGVPYGSCCEPLHRGAPAGDAVALMRSRYSAYVLRLTLYLLASWHPRTRPPVGDFDAGDPATRWLGLEVLRSSEQGEHATVEFVARYRVGGGRAVRLHETSRFERIEGRWLYVDGDIHPR